MGYKLYKRLHQMHSLWHSSSVQYTTMWICCTTERFTTKVFYIYPQCIMWMDKTGVYKIIFKKTSVLFGSVTSDRSVNVNSFVFCWVKCFFIFIGSQSVWETKNRFVWISVLCRHKFHLLQINSSEILNTLCYIVYAETRDFWRQWQEAVYSLTATLCVMNTSIRK